MSEEKNKDQVINQTLLDMIEEFVVFRNDTWAFFETAHDHKDTEARQKELRAMSKDLSALSNELLQGHAATNVADEKLNADLRLVEIAQNYARELAADLKNDYEAKKQENKDGKVDIVKNAAFLIASPAAFVAEVKNGVANGHIDANEAFVIGVAIAIPVVFHKRAMHLFNTAKKAICDVPSNLRAIPAAFGNDMRVVYVREIVKERTSDAAICFSAAAKSINDNVQTGRRQTTSLIKKVFRGKGPRPGA